jgi:enoyl-CoA hydratase/carnithine racemase
LSNGPDELAGGKILLDRPAELVARLTISNPAKRNALDLEMLDAIAAVVAGLEDVRCLILTGDHGMFSAGYDIGGIPDDVFADQAERLVAHPFAAAIEALEDFPYPTVAGLVGHTIGGGLELALSCDLRVAGEKITLGMPPAKLGLVYSHTGLRKFIDAIGVPRTRELFLVARNIPAERALAWNLVNEVVPMDDVPDRTLALAEELAGGAPLSLRGNKRVIRELLAAEGPLDPAVEQELIELRRACFRSEDFREGVRAFGEKRPPRWQNR